MSLWLRRCTTLACLVAAWLVVRPAQAAAPLCDEHAASMLAPLPILDTPDASVDVGERPDGCDTDANHDKAYQRGERPARSACSGEAGVLPGEPPCPILSASLQVLLSQENRTGERAGVRGMLERPPR